MVLVQLVQASHLPQTQEQLHSETRHGSNTKAQQPFPCQCPKPSGRKLVVCIDGTSNRFGEMNSNVVEFYGNIDKSPEANQLTYYNSGIGTYVKPSVTRPITFTVKWIDNTIDLGFAWNFKADIIAAYRWLSENYEPGDQLYFFGFSRGAYQVRALAGLIEVVGLIFRGNHEQIPFAYDLYADQRPGWLRRQIDRLQGCPLEARKKRETLADTFKKTFCRPDVKIHFVGVWDTVSSVGLFKGPSLKFTRKGDHVCFFRHALALDERRVKFLPEYVRQSGQSWPTTEAIKPSPVADQKPTNGPEGKFRDTKLSSMAESAAESQRKIQSAKISSMAEPKPIEPSGKIQSVKSSSVDMENGSHIRQLFAVPRVKEVWFAGSHSDIGGGNQSNLKLQLRRPSLLWMTHEAMMVGLRVKLLDPAPPEPGSETKEATANEDQQKDGENSKLVKTTKSLKWWALWWWFLEILPLLGWQTHKGRDAPQYSLQPHRGKGRLILPDQKIHISVHDTKAHYRPRAKFEEGKSKSTWRQVFENRETDISAWREKTERMDIRWKNRWETTLYDEETLTVLVSQLEQNGYPELFRYLRSIADKNDKEKTLLPVENVIPILWRLTQSEERDELLATLAERQHGNVSYEKALRNEALDAKAWKRVLDTHCHMLERKYFLCGTKVLSESVLTLNDHTRKVISETKAIAFLAAGIQNSTLSSDNVEICLDALSRLSRFKDFHQAVLDEGVIRILTNLLECEHCDKILCGAKTLSKMAKHGDIRAEIRKANPIMSLAVSLGRGDLRVREACKEALGVLTEDDASRQAILDPHIFSSVVEWLKSGDAGKVLGVAHLLRHLGDHEDGRAGIIATHAMSSLVDGLACNAEHAQTACGKALYRLAKHDKCRQAILETKVVYSVTNLLQSKALGDIFGGAKGVYFLADHAEFRNVILATNKIHSLVEHLVCDSKLVRTACRDALVDLFQYAECHKPILDAQVISTATVLLKSGDTDKMLDGIHLLHDLVAHAKCAKEIVTTDQIQHLVAGLSKETKAVQTACKYALIALAKHNDCRQPILEAKVIPAAMMWLKSTDADKILGGAHMLEALAEYSIFQKTIIEENPTPYLVTGLGNDNEAVQTGCGNALCHLADLEECHQALLQIIPSVLALLNSNEPSKIVGGAKGVYFLADPPKLRAAILAGHPMASLVAGLREESAENFKLVRAACKSALCDLAQHDECRLPMRDAGIQPAVIDLLQCGDINRICDGASVLQTLVDHKEFRSANFVEKVIPALVAGLCRDTKSVRTACKDILRAIAERKDCHQPILHSKAIPYTIVLLKSGNPSMILGATCILDVLMDEEDSDFQNNILEANPMQALVIGLGCRNESAQYACAYTLYNLANNNKLRRAIVTAKVIPSVMKLLKNDELTDIYGGAMGVFFLADHEELRRQILAGKAVEALVAGLGRDDESVQTACKDALLDLVQHDDGQAAVLDAQVVPSLITMLESKVLSMQTVAAHVLYSFARVDRIAAVIRKNDDVIRLLKQLSQDTDDDAEEAAQHAHDALLCLADEDETSDVSETRVDESPIDMEPGQRGIRYKFNTLAKSIRGLTVLPRYPRKRATLP